MTTSIYESQDYLNHNSTWHVEDSPWKAQQILKLLEKNNLKPLKVAEIGCGAGEILAQLSQHLSADCQFTGYDISPHLEPLWQERRGKNLNFVKADFLNIETVDDLLLLIDIVEHIEDYFNFLRQIKVRATYKIFNFPLEIFALKALLGHKYLDSRRKVGHIHYFNKDICLALLTELGFEILDYFYSPGAIDLANISSSVSPGSRLLKVPRQLLSFLSVDLTAKLLGGYSLFILAR